MRLFRESVAIMLSSHFCEKMASSEQENLSLSQNNVSILCATDTNELTIIEDSDNDNYDSEDFEEAYNDLFSDGIESDIEFGGFSSEMMKGVNR